MAATNRLNLAIGLPLRNREALTNLLQQLYDPSSPNYRHFLTPEEFTAQFGPSEQDYAAVVAFAQAQGLTVTTTYSNRLLVDVRGPVGTVEKALHVTMEMYRHPTENRTFYAPDAEPSVPSSLPIMQISGLENYYLPHSRILTMTNGFLPQAGSAPGGGYSASDLRKAYVPGTSLTGAGQSVGLLQFDGFYPNDVAQYASANNIQNPPQVVVVPVDGGVATPSEANIEVAMDIEMVMAMAPGVSTIYVYEAPNPSPWVDLLNRMALDGQVKQFSSSWGGGGPNAMAEQIFQQMAAQGQSFYNASGDTAAFIPNVNPPEFPSDSPNITQVGGTVLTTSSSGDYVSETVWNTPDIPRAASFQGSSGGVSPNYAIPTWQQGISMAANHGSTTMRNIPDVAMTASGIWIVYNNGTSGPAGGGTSSAAPLWAGFTALVNQQATAGGGSPIGFINPTIYAIGKSSSYSTVFHDITTGGNTNSLSPTNYLAVPGYDLCTGWGTPATALIAVLAGIPPRNGFLVLSVNPPSGSAILSSTTQPIFVTVNDVFGVTNATVTGTIAGVTNLTFLDNGQAPDTKANDGIYSANFQVPNLTTQVVMTVMATASGEIGATNLINYYIGSPPSNDNFVNATKVPVAGAAYLSNNRFATIETNEPLAVTDPAAAGSLWWNWTPANNTNVLIGTIGSKEDNLLAVYTGAVLTTNMPQMAKTNSNLSLYQPAQISFNALAGITYHIVVASVSSNSLGTVGLTVSPGGQPDVTKPLVSIGTPQNGLTVTNNLLQLAGTATDPQPNATGVGLVSINVNGSVYAASGTTNWTALASMQPGINTIQATAIDQSGNQSIPAKVEVSYIILGPANDFFAAAVPLSGASGAVTNSTLGATKEVGEPNHAGNSGGKSVWCSFKPSTDGVLILNTTNSTFDTLLGLYTGTTVSNLTTIASDDDAYSGAPGGFSYLVQAVRSNQTYYVAIDGYNGASGTNYLAYSFTPAPVYQLSVSNTVGGTVQVTTANGLGGIAVMPGSSGGFASGATVQVTATPDTFYQLDNWNGDSLLVANPLSVVIGSDTNITAYFSSVSFTDGFESGDLSHLPWATAGDAPWFVQSSVVAAGQYAARSGIIGNNQTSSLILTNNFLAGTVSFDYRVSSETNFDTLRFYVNGILQQQWSGEVGWATYSFPVNSGTNILEWTYVKDPTLTNGLDAAFIDNVTLPLAAVVTSLPPPATVQLVRGSDGRFVIQISGQANEHYVLQASTNLVDWQDISTNTAVGGSIQLTNLVNGFLSRLLLSYGCCALTVVGGTRPYSSPRFKTGINKYEGLRSNRRHRHGQKHSQQVVVRTPRSAG